MIKLGKAHIGHQDKPLGSSVKWEVRPPIQSQEKVVLPKVLKYRAYPLYSEVSQLVMVFFRNLPFNVPFLRHRDACVESADPPRSLGPYLPRLGTLVAHWWLGVSLRSCQTNVLWPPRGGKVKPAFSPPRDRCLQQYCDVYVGIH